MRVMAKHWKLVAALTAFALATLPACTPRDTGAEGLAEELTRALSDHDLEGIPLENPEALTAFTSHIDPLAEFPVEVTAGEVSYDMNDAVLPLHWEWQIQGNTWGYDTAVDLTYHDSQWWVTWHPSSLIPELEPGMQIGIGAVTPDRAEILTADGTPIITERAIRKFGLDKTKVAAEDVEEAARAIAEATGIDPDGFAAKAAAYGPQAFVDAITLRPEDVDRHVDPDFAELPGALSIGGEALLAPTPGFARELLGAAGEATAEIIENSDGAIVQGDIVGLSGLQRDYDAQLRGVAAVEVFGVDAGTCEPAECPPEERTVFANLDAGAPSPLVLTLDIEMQIAAEEALAGVERESDEDPPTSALVAIRPSTGEILTVANGGSNGGLNQASVGQYPPGSTFKVVTALALLRSGLAIDTLVECPNTTTVDGREFKNYDAYPAGALGQIPFITAFAESCNTALIELRERITGEDLAAAARALGLEPVLDGELGYPAFLGSVPIPEGGTEFAAALIGQGRSLVSPLAMATVAASVQAGTVVVPQLVEGATAEAAPDVPLTQTEAEELRALMRAVATSGTASALSDLPGEPVLAKTGTAEHGGGEDTLPHTWIIGVQGDLAVAVFVEAGVGGAETAGPVLKDFLERVG